MITKSLPSVFTNSVQRPQLSKGGMAAPARKVDVWLDGHQMETLTTAPVEYYEYPRHGLYTCCSDRSQSRAGNELLTSVRRQGICHHCTHLRPRHWQRVRTDTFSAQAMFQYEITPRSQPVGEMARLIILPLDFIVKHNLAVRLAVSLQQLRLNWWRTKFFLPSHRCAQHNLQHTNPNPYLLLSSTALNLLGTGSRVVK